MTELKRLTIFRLTVFCGHGNSPISYICKTNLLSVPRIMCGRLDYAKLCSSLEFFRIFVFQSFRAFFLQARCCHSQLHLMCQYLSRFYEILTTFVVQQKGVVVHVTIISWAEWALNEAFTHTYYTWMRVCVCICASAVCMSLIKCLHV